MVSIYELPSTSTTTHQVQNTIVHHEGVHISILSLALLLGYEKLSHVQRIYAYLSHNQSISPDRVFDIAGVKNLVSINRTIIFVQIVAAILEYTIRVCGKKGNFDKLFYPQC